MSQSAAGTQLRYAGPMTPRWRKLGLTAHIVASVGWLGAVAAFLALSLVGLENRDPMAVRAAYLAMQLIGGFVIVPLGLATLVTGVIQSLGTEWGLVRYYWVLAKLVLTIGAVALLLLHQFTEVAEAARRVSIAAAGLPPGADQLGLRLAATAALAVVALVAATVLSVFKPWGRIRRESSQTTGEPGQAASAYGFPPRLKIWLIVGGIIVAGFIALHLSGAIGRHRH